MKIRLTKRLHIGINLTRSARVSMLDSDGCAWDLWASVGMATEKDMPTIRAWQVRILWVSLSVWVTGCVPVTHKIHERREGV